MTAINPNEIKVIFFGLMFVGVLGVFLGLYFQEPIQQQSFQGNTTYTNSTTQTTDQDTWIGSIIGDLPVPFNDTTVLLISAIILTPIIILLTFISIRSIKDLVTQWI